MDRAEVLSQLRVVWPTLQAEYGVQSLTLFGSVARGDARPDSDVDMLVEFNRPTGYLGLVRLQLFLQKLLGREVDLGTPGSLGQALRERVREEAIHLKSEPRTQRSGAGGAAYSAALRARLGRTQQPGPPA